MHKLVVELEKQYLATQQVSQIYGRASKYIQSKNKAQEKANSLMEKRGKDYERAFLHLPFPHTPWNIN